MGALLLASGALAAGTPGAAAPAGTTENEQAKAHFERGRKHYELGEFTEALFEFKEAYRFKREPALLFDLGQAARGAGAKKEAAFYFGQYLNARPDAKNAAEARALVVEMEAAPAPGPAGPAMPATAGKSIPTQPVPMVPMSPESIALAAPPASASQARAPEFATEQSKAAGVAKAEKPGNRWVRPSSYGLAGLGVVLLGVGAYQGVHASSLVSDVNAAADGNGGYYKGGDLEKIKSARTANQLEKVALGVGVACLVAGVGLLLAF